MGIFKDSLKVVNEIVTLGGAGRIEEAKKAYQETYGEYLVLYNDANSYKTEIEEKIKVMGSALTQAKTYLEKSEKIIKRCLNEKNGLNVEFVTETLTKFDKFNSELNSAINVGMGTIAGGSLAVGSWALVTAMGSASTGIAISGLSGVAATNATLAWFGGGALAAGGAGMAGGMSVLSGIFAIPLVYIAAKSSHKKAKELEEATTKVKVAILEIQKQIQMLPSVLEAIKLKSYETNQLCYVLIADIIKLSQKIRPHGILSVTNQKFRSLLGKDPYTQEQAEALQQLNLAVSKFLAEFAIHDSLEPPEKGATSEIAIDK